ncbi:MAG: LysR family transcriptional regulator [Jatrophihabitantaceae bacterium]
MDTEGLRWFQQVADGVTVTEVALIEQVTQPAVSRALARLEAELGTPLLRRSGRILRMTEAGAAFKRHVDGLLHELDDGLAAIDQLIDPETGSVSLAYQPSLGTWLVPELIAGFHRLHPGVRFELHPVRGNVSASGLSTSGLSTSGLSGGDVDLEITTRRTDPSVQWRLLRVEPLLLAVGPRHRFAHRKRVALAELADDEFVLPRSSSTLRKLTEQLTEQAGFQPRIAFEGDDLPTLRGFVAASLGVAIMPRPGGPSGTGTPAGVHYLAIEAPPAQRVISLAWSKHRRLLPAAELFRRYVAGQARGERSS